MSRARGGGPRVRGRAPPGPPPPARPSPLRRLAEWLGLGRGPAGV